MILIILEERNNLSIRYKSRLKKFIVQTINNIPKQEDSYNPIPSNSKSSEPSIRINYHGSEKERILETLKDRKLLDTIPSTQNIILYRKREPEKDICPALRFKPKNDTERIIDYIKSNGYFRLQSIKIQNELK